jgi:hypothetical protein
MGGGVGSLGTGGSLRGGRGGAIDAERSIGCCVIGQTFVSTS